MIFADISSERAIRVFKKVGFWISKVGGKHIGMTDGKRKIIHSSPQEIKSLYT